MDLYLHKVIHPQADDNYRVILKREDGEARGEPRRQSRSAFKRVCATAAWPDALQ